MCTYVYNIYIYIYIYIMYIIHMYVHIYIYIYNMYCIISPPNKNPPLGGNKYLLLTIYTEARLPPS